MVPVAPVLVLAAQPSVTDVPPVAETAVGGARVAVVSVALLESVAVNRARLIGTVAAPSRTTATVAASAGRRPGRSRRGRTGRSRSSAAVTVGVSRRGRRPPRAHAEAGRPARTGPRAVQPPVTRRARARGRAVPPHLVKSWR